MTKKSHKLFVNIAVSDLARSMQFFRTLGFDFNPKFTDQNAACMVVSEDAYFMLLSEPFFRNFTTRTKCDTTTHTEALFAFSCDSRAEVDEFVNIALQAGASRAMDPVDHGFMYGSSFYDPDGHHFEVFWMDPVAAEQGPPQMQEPLAVQ